jgi:hypothetical protein
MNILADEHKILQIVLRKDFMPFIRKVFTTLAPGQTHVVCLGKIRIWVSIASRAGFLVGRSRG